MSIPQKRQIYIFFILLSGLVSCAKMSEENTLRQRIDDLVQVIEAHDENKINGFLAADFIAGNQSTRENFNLFISYHLQRNRNISIVRANEKISINGVKADVTSDVFLTGSGGWLPQRGENFRVESRWIKEKNSWLIQRLRWQKE